MAPLSRAFLPLVVDNPRFLILPWIEIPNLGSHILALVRRRLPEDWAERYNTAPVLIETFVETPRYTGAVYRASGWLRVGATQGRGRYDRDKLYDKPRKDVWLRPLRRDWRRAIKRILHGLTERLPGLHGTTESLPVTRNDSVVPWRRKAFGRLRVQLPDNSAICFQSCLELLGQIREHV